VPSRIVVNRISAGSTSFHSATVGLRVPSGVSSGATEDKPMMTVDNDPGSPTYGRLYAVWNAPKGAGIRVEIAQCDSQPNPANCDNADNWSTPVDVTPSTGSYIYADVAVGHAPTRFDEDGTLRDEELRDQLLEALDVLLAETPAQFLALAV